MEDRTPSPDTLDPAERMSVADIRSLQLDRLRSTLRTAYERVDHYRRSFGRRAVDQ